MNRFLLFLAFTITGITAFSQKVYFMYFQTEPARPFYLKTGGQVYSSSASGYLILSKLRDSTYAIQIGFPGEKGTEHSFSMAVEKKDHGYLVKNFGEKGWGLFDLQTLAVRMPEAAATQVVAKKDQDVSDFTEVLSKAADDPSLKEKPAPVKTAEPVVKANPEVKDIVEDKALVKKEEVKKEEVKKEEVKKEELPSLVKEEVKKEEVKKEEVKKEELSSVVKEEVKKEVPSAVSGKDVKQADALPNDPDTQYKPSVVTRRSESSTTEGFGLVYTDETARGSVDTIRLLIPNVVKAPVPVVKKEEPREERKFLDIGDKDTVKKVEVKMTEPAVEPKPVVAAEKPVADPPPATKISCPATAGESDFLEVRKRMAAETQDDDMITEAKKYFRTKCFTTLQIRNLSLLFLNEEGKYHFFDAAYPYASDPENFSSLQAELKDTYYINRFRAMLRL